MIREIDPFGRGPIQKHEGCSQAERPPLFTVYRPLFTFLLSLYFSAGTVAAIASVPAFPGAEGAGAYSVGGRGGVVCEVTNLNDSGSGSLRACVDMKGPRTVIFRVAGTIKLDRALQVTNPYLTIAGQTAPGGGIQLVGKTPGTIPHGSSNPGDANLGGLLRITTHDVIVRYIRLRHGYVGSEGLGRTYAVHISDGGDGNHVYNVILDHMSTFWAHDENLTIWARNGKPAPGIQNITIQNSIFAETLEGHATPIIFSAASADAGMLLRDVDLVRNLIANGTHRMPRLASGQRYRVVNNIIYNWTGAGSQSVGGVDSDWVGNLWTHGPMAKGPRGAREIGVELTDGERVIPGDPSIHTSGNFGPFHGADQFEMVKYATSTNGVFVGTLGEEFRRSQPLDGVGVPISVTPVQELESALLPVVGASRRLDCKGEWIPNRDSQDSRLINGYARNEGSIVRHEDEVGGFPVLASAQPCRDSSGDGIPDEWLMLNGFDPNDRVGHLIHGSGYSYLELYLNGPAQDSSRPPSAPSAISVSWLKTAK